MVTKPRSASELHPHHSSRNIERTVRSMNPKREQVLLPELELAPVEVVAAWQQLVPRNTPAIQLNIAHSDLQIDHKIVDPNTGFRCPT